MPELMAVGPFQTKSMQTTTNLVNYTVMHAADRGLLRLDTEWSLIWSAKYRSKQEAGH